MFRWIDRILDASIIFSFDRSGYLRHCSEPINKKTLQQHHGLITGASSGIGLTLSESLLQRGMQLELPVRNLEKAKKQFENNPHISRVHFSALNLNDLSAVYDYAHRLPAAVPLDLIVHNAGEMPPDLVLTEEGIEQVFTSQVLAPYILTKELMKLEKVKKSGRIIFVSSGGMYLKKLDLSDLNFQKSSYNKYIAYANAKRAQVILAELFANKYPEYLFSSMHPGWVNTPGVARSMPLFKKLLGKRLRTAEQGIDTILWLATEDAYPNGKFWFDRKETSPTIGQWNATEEKDKRTLWNLCENTLNAVKSKAS